MKKRFTRILAALALLVFMTPSMVAWGQSDYSTDYTGNVTLSTTGGTEATECTINIGNSTYDGIKAGTSKKAGAVRITVPSGTKYLHMHLAGWNNESVTVSVSPNTNVNPSSIALTSDPGISGSGSSFTLQGENLGNYYKVITFNNALVNDTYFTFSSGKRFVVWGVTAEAESTTTTDPTITFIDGSVNVGKTLDLGTLFTSNSSGAVTYTITEGNSYANLNGSTLTGVAEGSVTVLASQAAAGSYNAGEATATIAVNEAPTLSSIAITTPPTKTTYTVGETFDPTGMVVTASYSDASTEEVTASCTWTPNGALSTSDTEITVSYTENDVTKTATQTITVTEYVQPMEFNVALNNVAFGCGIGNNAVEQSFTTNNTEFVAGCSTSATAKTYYAANHVRFYDGSYLNITAPEGYIITKTVFTADGTWSGGISVNSGTYTNDTKTWEGGIDQLNFSFAAQNRISSVAITLAVPGVEYVITYATNLTNGSFAEGNPASAIAGVPVTVQTTPSNGYYLATMTYNDGTNTENAIVSGNSGTFTMPEHDVTVSATFSELSYTNYQLVNSVSEIVSGKHYIIVGGSEEYYAMGIQNTNNRAAVEITVEEGVASVSNIDPVREVVINGPDAEGFYIIYDAEEPGYLYAPVTNDKNYLKTQTFNDNKGQWTISIDAENGANIVANASGSNKMRFNSSNSIFSCYASGQSDIFLYVKEGETNYTFYKDITGYTTSTGGYVLVASPVSSTTPADAGMITDTEGANATPETATYDLYSYNQVEDLEWRNYRANSFNLVPGKGYLYASKNGVTLHFNGEMSTEFADVTLPYNASDFAKSIYLAGNSLTEAQTFYVYDNNLNKQTFNYITLNGEGSAFVVNQATSYSAPALQGFFVQAAGENWKLSTADMDDDAVASLLNVKVLRNTGSLLDNAIVSFGNGSMMNKFYLSNNTTRVYIPQNNREMAVVRSAAEAEMPVSFRASENGTYTLAVEAENVEMNYLHLIDNLTGMDVDLLQTPSYTFEAKTSDYTSRFRLVFKANGTNENNAETFAYFNGTNWTVSNVGDATLQVVDVTGRTVANQMINGNAELNLNQPAGVYVIRLVNGDNVKTQKVVVR